MFVSVVTLLVVVVLLAKFDMADDLFDGCSESNGHDESECVEFEHNEENELHDNDDEHDDVEVNDNDDDDDDNDIDDD